MAEASKTTGSPRSQASSRQNQAVLPFERSILALEKKIDELRAIPDVSLNGELRPLEKKRRKGGE